MIMKKNILRIAVIIFTVGLFGILDLKGEEDKKPSGLHPIKLPPPNMTGGKPLMDALKERKSTRNFKPDKLPVQVLSNLLWAAFGINRPDSGKRTAPSAMNWQEIDIYAVMKEGVFVYNAKDNTLEPVLNKDVRGDTGRMIQRFVSKAPLNLVYVADLSLVSAVGGILTGDEEMTIFSSVSAGAIVQNVYLFCASEGLATVVRGLIDKDAFIKDVGLSSQQKIIIAQTVGYPKK
jgi:nitroreductase